VAGREDRREHIRFSTNLKGRYSTEGLSKNWEECTVLDASGKGMGIKFHTSEGIKVGSIINLETVVPSQTEPFNVRGTLKWIKQKETELIGGLEFAEVLDEIKSLIIMLEG
jgi:hypothetical protein